MNAEQRAIESLRTNAGQLRSELINLLPQLFTELRAIEDRIVKLSPGVLYEPMWGFLGLMTRAYQLMICCTEQLANRNFNGFYASFRGLVETLCAVIWASGKPTRLAALVQQTPVSVGKVVNAGYRKYPDLRNIYSMASGIAHPNRNGHGLTPAEADGDRIFTPFSLDFSEWFAAAKLNLLIHISSRIVDELQQFVARQSGELTKGRVMASRRKGEGR